MCSVVSRWATGVCVGVLASACGGPPNVAGEPPTGPTAAEASPGGVPSTPPEAGPTAARATPVPPSTASAPAGTAPALETPAFAPARVPLSDTSLGVRDERPNPSPRARSVLVTELEGLERLYKSQASHSPDRAPLTRRLADTYLELVRAAKRDVEAANAAGSSAEATQAEKVARAAFSKAVTFHRLLKDQHPADAKLDEVLYYLGYEHEVAGDYANARQYYFALIEKTPTSSLVPHAYLAFGELFFSEALRDPSKWELAAAAYREVLKYPAPQNRVYSYARYRLGFVHWHRDELANAINEFKKTVESCAQNPGGPNSHQLEEAATGALIGVYALAGAPSKAYRFFQTLIGDGEGSDERTIGLLLALLNAYVAAGQAEPAAELSLDLLGRYRPRRDARVCAAPPQAVASALNRTTRATELARRRSEVCR